MTSPVRCALGPAAVEALAGAIAAAQAADRLAPVTVAVPNAYAGLSLRRLLGSRPGGVVHVQFLPIARVAELLGAPVLAASGRRPLTEPVRLQAIRAVLADEPGMFGEFATHPATERSVAAALRELRRCTPAALAGVAASSRRASDLVRLHRRVRAKLEAGWYDEHDLAEAAARAVADGTASFDDLGVLVTFCLRRLAPSMTALITSLGDRAVVIEADPDAPAPVADQLVGAPDPDDEVRAAIRLLLQRLEGEQPVPLHRMAILYPAAEPYALLVHQQLAAAGIPHNGPGSRRLRHTVSGTALLGMLALPDGGWRRDDVMAWLASAPIIESERAAPVPAATWDTVSRQAGVVAGPEQWQRRLRAHGERLSARRDAGTLGAGGPDDHEVDERRRAAADREIDHAERLRLFVEELVTAVDPRPRGGWAAMSEWADTLLHRYLGGDSRHGRWPEDEQEAWRSVREAVGRLAGLDGVGGPCDLNTFRRAVEEELDHPAGRVGTFGDGVLVAPVTAALGTDLDTVFVLGMAEGTFPSRGHDDALLPDADRRGAGGELPLREARMAEEHFAFRAAMAAAPERVLLWPRGDLRRSRSRLPSRWLVESARALSGRDVYSADLEQLAAEDNRVAIVASFEGGVRGAASPASLTDRDLASLLTWTNNGGAATGHYLAADQPRLGRGWEVTAARQSTAFTRFDGNVGGGAAAAFRSGDVLSATSLEAYATCPMRYFLGRVLRLDTAERPEEILSISALDKGTLMHAVLERYVLERLGGAPSSIERLHEIAAELFAEVEALGLSGKPLLWRYEQRLMLRELSSYHALDALTPRAAELAFGMEGEPPVEVVLSDGRTIAFRGKADRVDDDGEGGLVVTDYKTGSGYGYENVAKDPVDRGRKLQLPLYGLAARGRFGAGLDVLSRYWVVSERAGYRVHAIPVDDTVLQRFREVIEVIVDGITSGAFLARPGEPYWKGGWDNCSFCDFNSLCQEERDVHWTRKKGAMSLSSYVTMTETEPDRGEGG